MKKLNFLVSVLTVVFSVLLSLDDSYPAIIHSGTVETPVRSDCQDITHHHHFSLTDHYFQKNTVSDSGLQSSQCFILIHSDQPVSSQYLSYIWQPPQVTC